MIVEAPVGAGGHDNVMYSRFHSYETHSGITKEEVSEMINKRTSMFFLALLAMILLVAACGPSEEQLRARDEARAAVLAAEARAVSLENEFASLPTEIAQLEAQIVQLQAEKNQLQAEYESLGGTGR